MRKMQLAASALTLAVLAFAALPQARADVYDYGYGPVYSSYPATNGTTCPNGQCSGSNYAPAYSSYPTYGAPCPNGSCGSCPNGMCGLRGSCASGQCSTGQCSSGQCASGQCTNGQCSTGQCPNGQCASGSCRSGRCGYCPNGDCDSGHCSGNCPNGQCRTRYRGPVDSLSPPNAPVYDRPDYGTPDGPRARPIYSTERPVSREYRDSDYRDRDYRDRDYRDRDYRSRDDRDRSVRDGGFRDAGYHDRDFRDRASLEQPVSHRTWRTDSRPLSRDGQMESPFYN
jgi:hypothetical protein